ncbi:MAG: Rieske 2Fe-2S domain-containing protein, partial [Leptospiraceae bacterium]|nr:Rieske 2Fe-2S domain-containing protein [Leptospiraceae bacterium]
MQSDANFLNKHRLVESWYWLDRSRAIRNGRRRAYQLAGLAVLVGRNHNGELFALPRYCPHLGADLKLADIEANGVRCRLHGWLIQGDGHCRTATDGESDRQIARFTIEESDGIIWFYPGVPRFNRPELQPDLHRLRFPARTVRCHPHLVLPNGLDRMHYEHLHGLKARTQHPIHAVDANTIALPLHLEMPERKRPFFGERRGGTTVRGCFQTIGAGMALARVDAPLQFYMLFAATPDQHGHARMQTTLYTYRRRDVPRAVSVMRVFLRQDVRILESMRFRQHLTAD